MQENIVNSNMVVQETPVQNVESNVENKEMSQEKIIETINAEAEKTTNEVETLSKRSIKLEDGTIIDNLKITYKNLFDFQNHYDDSKDLMEALVKKQTFEHEVMVQLIYVGYLGTNPTNKMEYFDFIDAIPFDYKRDMALFQELTGLRADSKN